MPKVVNKYQNPKTTPHEEKSSLVSINKVGSACPTADLRNYSFLLKKLLPTVEKECFCLIFHNHSKTPKSNEKNIICAWFVP
jgi:hypothetical protein